MKNDTQSRKDVSGRIPEVKLREVWRILLVHKWVVILGFVIVLAATVLYLRWETPVYQAWVVMMTKQDYNPASALFGGAEMMYPYGSELEDESQLLGSSLIRREIAVRMAQQGMSSPGGGIPGGIFLSSRSPNIFAIAATSYDPEKAMVLANTSADVYISKMSELRDAGIREAESFLSEQMTIVDGKLRQAEEALNAFREQEGIVGFYKDEGSSGLLAQLGNLYAELSKVQNERELTQAKLTATREMLDSKKEQATSLGNNRLASQIDSLQSLITGWQVELVTLRQTLTDRSPEITSLTDRIAVAQEQLDSHFQELKKYGVSIDPLSEWRSLVQEAVQMEIQIKGLEQNEKAQADRIAKFKADHPELISKEVELTRLTRTARIHEQTYMLLMDKYEEARLLKRTKASGIAIIDRATRPGRPVKPNKRMVLTLGVLMGLIAGAGAAFFLEYLDDSLKVERDIDRSLGLPVVGVIPMIQVGKAALKAMDDKRLNNSRSIGQGTDNYMDNDAYAISEPPMDGSNDASLPVRKKSKYSKKHQRSLSQLMARMVTNLDHKSPVAESYRGLWTNIQFANVDEAVKTILVSSSGPREGKTLTVANLAITIARMGAKTLIIDTDLRRPRLHNAFGQKKEPGLSDILVGGNGLAPENSPERELSDDLGDVPNIMGLVRETGIDNLYLITSGKRPPNPAELLSSGRKRQLVAALKPEFDVILFDSPPIMPVTDASILASEMADIVLLVVRSGETKQEVAQKAQELLERVDANIFGAVLNMVDYAKQYGSYYYYYYYHYYYSHDDEEE